MYYEVRDLIKKEYENEFFLTKNEKKHLTVYLIGALIALIFYILWMINKESFFILGMIIGIGIGIYNIIKANQFEQEYNVKKHVQAIIGGIEKLGLNSPEKVEKLRKEIIEFNVREEEKLKKLFDLIGRTFKNIFWIPLSFLLGLFFNENFPNNISFDDIVILSTGVLTLALIFIGVAIAFFPHVPYIFQYGRREREKVLQYLLDIEYFQQEKKRS